MSLYVDERASNNQTALIIAKAKYHEQLSPFVKKSLVRLAYAEPEVNRIIAEAVYEADADTEYVTHRFKAHLREYVAAPDWGPAVEVTKPKHEELAYQSDSESYPNGNNDTSTDPPEGIHRDDVTNHSDVDGAGLEEALDSGTKVDLNNSTTASLKDESTWSDCFRCGDKLNPVHAAVSPVCKECTQKLADWPGEDTDVEQGGQAGKAVRGPNDSQLFQCSICREAGQLVKGTHPEIQAHVESDHQDVLDKATHKQADVPQGTTDQAVVPPAETTPADRFDDMVQDLADRAAAQQFSMPTDEDINAIAGQYGVDADQIKNNLYATAMFGKYKGANGQIGNEITAPDGYTEVQLQQAGQGSQEAIVPTDAVVRKVADETGETPEFVYQQVKDKYGADLPDKYHASVSGELHYYLPEQLVGSQQPPQAQPPAQPQAAPPMPPQQQPGM